MPACFSRRTKMAHHCEWYTRVRSPTSRSALVVMGLVLPLWRWTFFADCHDVRPIVTVDASTPAVGVVVALVKAEVLWEIRFRFRPLDHCGVKCGSRQLHVWHVCPRDYDRERAVVRWCDRLVRLFRANVAPEIARSSRSLR